MSNEPEFWQTRLGVKFYEGMVPRIADALDGIAKELKRGNDLKDRPAVEGAPKPPPTAEEHPGMCWGAYLDSTPECRQCFLADRCKNQTEANFLRTKRIGLG